MKPIKRIYAIFPHSTEEYLLTDDRWLAKQTMIFAHSLGLQRGADEFADDYVVYEYSNYSEVVFNADYFDQLLEHINDLKNAFEY